MTMTPLRPPPLMREQPSDKVVHLVASLHRFMMILWLGQCLVGFLFLVFFIVAFDPVPWVARLGFQGLIGFSLSLCLCSAAATWRVGRCMKVEQVFLYAIASGLPFIGMALVISLDGEIREYLAANGVTVGILGVSAKDADKLMR